VLKVELHHTYPAPLHNLKLTASGQGVSGSSQVLAALRPTEVADDRDPPFGSKSAASGEVPLTVVLECPELKEPATFSVSIRPPRPIGPRRGEN